MVIQSPKQISATPDIIDYRANVRVAGVNSKEKLWSVSLIPIGDGMPT